jgi:hypothetical protein
MNNSTEHTEDCTGGAECAPIEGQWDQPPGIYVEEAHSELGDTAPWCQIRKSAFELAGGGS